MRNDLSACSGRLLSYGPAIGTAAWLVVSAGLCGCSGDDNKANSVPSHVDGGGMDSGGVNDAGMGGDAGDSAAGDSAAEGGTKGSGQIATISKAANDPSFSSPFDATPSPDGSTVFFTAVAADGTGGVFAVSASGGAVNRLDSGGLLVSPSGIAVSEDGKQLYVADPAADDDTSDKYGAIFVLPTAGGAPTILAGTQGMRPRGVEVVGSTLYFTGTQSPGGAGAYSIARAGGQATAIAAGAPFVDPSGIAVAQSGDVYVADTFASPSRLAAVVKVAAGQATVVVPDLGVGFPAGIALAQDESALIISGLDPATQTDVVYRVALGASQRMDAISNMISTFGEPAGLHRAHGADIYAWADSRANGTGTVYTLSK